MPLDFLFGSVEENAEREHASYDPRTGKRKKDLGDHIGDFITGRGSAIDEAVKREHTDRLNRSYGVTIGELNNTPGISLQIDDRTDPTVLEQQINAAKPKAAAMKSALQQAALADVVIDTTKLTTPEAVIQHVVSTKKGRTDKKEKEERDRKFTETRRQEDRAERLERERVAREDARMEQLDFREDRKDERARLDRMEDRRLTAEQNKMQMQLSYDRLAMQERNNMQARKDKAIAMLFQGLGNLGAGFAI